jgi:hypothetical protein
VEKMYEKLAPGNCWEMEISAEKKSLPYEFRTQRAAILYKNVQKSTPGAQPRLELILTVCRAALLVTEQHENHVNRPLAG